MSFYGNVTYYLSNAFKQIIYENTKTSSTTTPTSNSSDGAQYQMTPGSQYDSTKLMAGNTWVRFGRDPSDEPLNQCYIFHKLTGLGEKTFSVQSVTGTADLEPSFGSIFTVPQITFDAAGHLSSGKEIKIKLPPNPGVEDIDQLKRRLATLEELITGDHGDSGGGSGSGSGDGDIPDVIIPYSTEISDIKTKINDWEMYFHQDPSDSTWRYKEGNGIGTTLHQVMVEIGLRKPVQYQNAATGTWVTGYQEVDQANLMTDAPNSILAKATSAQAIATSTSVVTEITRAGIRDLLQYLVNNHALGEDDMNRLILNYFQAGNS